MAWLGELVPLLHRHHVAVPWLDMILLWPSNSTALKHKVFPMTFIAPTLRHISRHLNTSLVGDMTQY